MPIISQLNASGSQVLHTSRLVTGRVVSPSAFTFGGQMVDTILFRGSKFLTISNLSLDCRGGWCSLF